MSEALQELARHWRAETASDVLNGLASRERSWARWTAPGLLTTAGLATSLAAGFVWLTARSGSSLDAGFAAFFAAAAVVAVWLRGSADEPDAVASMVHGLKASRAAELRLLEGPAVLVWVGLLVAGAGLCAGAMNVLIAAQSPAGASLAGVVCGGLLAAVPCSVRWRSRRSVALRRQLALLDQWLDADGE
jgi:hypothetical protein